MATRVLRGGRAYPMPETRQPRPGASLEQTERPVYVIAGDAAGRCALLESLLAGRSRSIDRAAWPATMISWQHTDVWEIGWYLPGHREPIPVDPCTGGWIPTARVPRSVAIGCPAELLKHVELVEVPAITADEPVLAPLIRQAALDATAVIYLLSDGRGWQADEIAVLGQLTAAGVPVWIGLDRLPHGTDAQALVAARAAEVPGTYVVPTLGDDGDQSLAAGLCSLLLADPVPARRNDGWSLAKEVLSRPGARPWRPPATTPSRGRPAPIEVGSGDWAQCLEHAVGRARTALAAVVAQTLAELRQRCTDLLPDRMAALAVTVDRQLYATALHLGEAWRHAVTGIRRELLTALLVEAPTEEAHARLAAAQHRSASAPRRRTPHMLLVTLTGAVAAMTDEPDAPAREPFADLDIALSDSGYTHLIGRSPTERKEALVWLALATAQVECELLAMIDRELEELRYALGAAATEAAEHGMLLM